MDNKTSYKKKNIFKIDKFKNYFFMHYKLFILGFVVIFVIVSFLQIKSQMGDGLTLKEIFNKTDISEFISTVTIIIGAVMAWVELHNSSRLSEADYIKDLNNHFIENKEMVDVEHALEMYFNEMDCGFENVKLDLDLRQNNIDRQKLVNYLVYLEGLASIINHNVIQIDQINSLFGYRFFVAINNPVVQMTELYPYADYYQGIIKIYNSWLDYCKINDVNENNADKELMRIPLYDYKLMPNRFINDYKDFKVKPRIRKANSKDNSKVIATLLYETDNFIYPKLFDSESASLTKEDVINNLELLIKEKNGLFSYKNILVAVDRVRKKINGVEIKNENGEYEYEDKINGILVYSDGMKESLWNEAQVIEKVGKSDNLLKASKEYFNQYTKETDKMVKIVAISVDESHRGKNYATLLLCQLSNLYCDYEMELDVLESNEKAIKIYERMLFKKSFTKDGFAIGESKPKCRVMKRSALCIIK